MYKEMYPTVEQVYRIKLNQTVVLLQIVIIIKVTTEKYTYLKILNFDLKTLM